MSTLTLAPETRIDPDEQTYLVEDFGLPAVEGTLEENAELERNRIDELIFTGLLAI